MTGRNEKAPARATHRGGGTTPLRQESSWHTPTQNFDHLSRGAATARRLITRAADAGQTLSLAELARAAGVPVRTALLWLRELDAPRSADARTPWARTPDAATPRLPGGPRDAP